MKKQMNELLYVAGKTNKHDFGKIFENYISVEYGVELFPKNTSKWDGVIKDKNGTRIYVSIKMTNINGKNDIVMSCIRRQASINEDFFLCLGLWDKFEYNIVKVIVIKINGKFWNSLFNHSLVEKFDRVIKLDKEMKSNRIATTPNEVAVENKIIANTFTANYNLYSSEWKKSGYNIISPRKRPLADSTSRVQCAIRLNKLTNYIMKNPLNVYKYGKKPELTSYIEHAEAYLRSRVLDKNMELVNGKYRIVEKPAPYFNFDLYRPLLLEEINFRKASKSDIENINETFKD